MISRQWKLLFGVALLMLIILIPTVGCNMPGSSPPPATEVDQDKLSTEVAETVAARLLLTQAQGELVVEPSDTLSPAIQAATDTPTPAITDTPAATTTLAVPVISASVDTNCRTGPSKLYAPPVGVLLVGQTAKVFGRHAQGTWWYIENTGRAGSFCWVWAETTSVDGDASTLPVITPPPLPPTATFTATPSTGFTLSYSTVHNCSGTPTAIFQVSNVGNQAFESLNLKIDDLTASTTLYGSTSNDAPFMGSSGECPPGGDTLAVGQTLYIGGAIGPGNAGHTAKAYVKLCTEDGLAGTCVDKSVEFTIP